ncbi:hypothetical protein PVK06_016361 [Gossypium arboreum]|uniref:Uncharacterized protein n=1 Tax=Gossypium arboreum TaxID=29729 RepID=A0ABR0Q082_GOSAR|nr:hypothetical protein PVK06_016361 [Gossypium arboreum]
MEALHKLDLRGKTDENCQDYHKKFIDVWDPPYFYLSYKYIFWDTSVPSILRLHAKIDAEANAKSNTDACTVINDDTDVDTNAIIDASINA